MKFHFLFFKHCVSKLFSSWYESDFDLNPNLIYFLQAAKTSMTTKEALAKWVK